MWRVRADYREVKNLYNSKEEELQKYLKHLGKILEYTDVKVGIIYVFSKIELLLREVLYYKIVNEYKTKSLDTWEAVSNEHIGRESYLGLFKNCFEAELDKKLMEKYYKEAKIRDNIMHGLDRNEYILEVNCLKNAINFLEEFICFVEPRLGFNPLKKLTGKIKGGKLDNKQTFLLLKGLGFFKRNSEN